MAHKKNIVSNTEIPIIYASSFELGDKYPQIGGGVEGSVYNYNDMYAVKRFNFFITMNFFYEKKLKRKFAKVEAMTELKDEAFCYPIGLLQSDETTKEGCFTDLVQYNPDIKDFNYLKELKNIRLILKYILMADAAVQRAHKNGVVIGDIKEDNIMIDINGNVKFVDTDNYAYLDFGFDLPPKRAECLKTIYKKPVSLVDNDIFVFAVMALRLLTHDDAFYCFAGTEDYYRDLISELNVSKEVKDGLEIIFSDAPNKPYIGPILQKIDFNKKRGILL